MNNAQRVWQSLVTNNVDKVTYLPCNKLNALMQQVPENIDVLNITKESIGLAQCFGRSLAGKRSAMMIQNTGLGNLVTELYTMQKLYQSALPIFVSWRGYYQEPIEAQIIFGSKVEDLLKAIDVEYAILKSEADLVDIDADIAACFEANKVKVYLMSPELWESNSADFHVFGEPRINPVAVEAEGYSGTPTGTRIDAIKLVLESIGEDDIVLSQIGFPSKEVYNTRDRDLNFYMLGALGAATEVGIGLAEECKNRHVYVIDGDGSFFFNPNQLADIATFDPENLTIICLDNGSWGSTGNQPTLSSRGMNLSAMIKSMGVSNTTMTDNPQQFCEALKNKSRFVHFMIQAGNDKVGGEIPLKALEIKERFMAAVGEKV
jgi:sulfopyruvate decarboxylase beta subunit